MYEKFKNQFALSLSSSYSKEDIEVILRKLDSVSYNYEINQKETSVVLYNYEIPEMVKTYLVCKKVEGMSDGSTTMIYAKVSMENVQSNHKKYVV